MNRKHIETQGASQNNSMNLTSKSAAAVEKENEKKDIDQLQ